MKLRITGTMLTSERFDGPFAHHTCAVFDGERQIGVIEYLGITHRGVTRYGWRPRLSGWTGAQLKTKRDAALTLSVSS